MALAVLHELQEGQNVGRTFRDRQNPLDFMEDEVLVQNYRLNRAAIFDLCSQLNDDLEHPTSRSRALPVSLQVCVALRYYAKGDFQSEIADIHGLSRMSVSRCVHTVSRCLCSKVRSHISFPRTNTEQQLLKERFFNVSGFPNVLGAIDGTFVPIKSPGGEEEHLFVCRKGYHCLNIQGICDDSLRFLSIVAQWPGSTHDSHIWTNCHLHSQFESGEIGDGWLLGDSAYPCRHFMMTPLLNPATAAERAYNQAHKRTRSLVERLFGVWKSRFRCLHKSGGCMMFSPERCKNIIVATAIIHNVARKQSIDLMNDDVNVAEATSDDHGGNVEVVGNDVNETGIQVRSELIANFF